MKLNLFGRTSAFIAQVAIDEHIPFTDAIELVIQNATLCDRCKTSYERKKP